MFSLISHIHASSSFLCFEIAPNEFLSLFFSVRHFGNLFSPSLSQSKSTNQNKNRFVDGLVVGSGIACVLSAIRRLRSVVVDSALSGAGKQREVTSTLIGSHTSCDSKVVPVDSPRKRT
ncbi:hypothetical protein QR680_005903 [Steinernema hermaphroditum]|uniref:Uncharacterized protein n=1 Tax=Steinernema hermaphroditum TaxID=289476 RepID=A0AA39HTN8_9BILA|nr:hypothetical protein QR680_005903 [Steinernema hermaphroditum]